MLTVRYQNSLKAMNLSFKIIPENKNWVVLYTKSRREKKVAEFCNLSSIISFLPLERRVTQYGKKRVISMIPLFRGYLFCCCNEKEKYDMLMTHQIAEILPVVNQFRLLKDLEKIYIAQNAVMDLKSCQLVEKGQRVLILSGPLSGYEGIVERIKGRKRLVINVDFIQRAASVEVDQLNVQPV